MQSIRLGRASCILLGLTAAVLVQACSTGKEKPDQPLVKSLWIEGTRQVSQSEIKDKILTEESGALWLPSWFPFFAARHYFDPNAWQADLRRIPRIYQSEGFFNARIVDSQIIPHSKDVVDLRVTVEEGPPSRIHLIDIKGLDALPERHRADALQDLSLREGEIFKEYNWQGVKGGMQAKLREDGYAEAVVNGEVVADVATQQADIHIDAQPGQRYRFGDVFISTGPRPRVRSSWIYDQAEAAVKKGSWYSDSALTEAQNRVLKMGVFGAVKVNRGAPDREAGTLPVVVDVREAPFHTIRAGGGIGVDQVRNEVRVLAEYVDRDFYGGLRKLTLRARVGWAFIPNVFDALGGSATVATKSEPIYLASAELEQPRFVFRDVRLATALSSERSAEQAYSYVNGKAKVGFIWQPHSSLSIYPSYNIEGDYLLSGQVVVGGKTPPLFFGPQCTSPNCFVTLSYLEQAITWDRRDDPVEPRKGYYLSLNFQESGGFLQGSFDYVRIRPEARYYHSFGREKKVTLSARLTLGTMRPQHGSGSPINNRFYSGGDGMRGFNYHRLSPLSAVQQDPNQTQKDGVAGPLGLQGVTVPIGGHGLVEGALELRYNFAGNFVLALFFDTGFVSAVDIWTGVKNDSRYFTSNLQYAVGIGLRYLTVVGPIRIDFAYRLPLGSPPLTILQPSPALTLPPVDGGCFGTTLFGAFPSTNPPSFAGYPEGRCAFHLSIGEAF